MIIKLCLALCLALTVGVSHAAASEKLATAADLALVQQQLQTQGQELAIHKHTLQISLESVDKRLTDFATLATMQGSHTAWVGYLITVLIFVAGFITYFSATARAEKEARDASEQWFLKNHQKLLAQINQLQQNADKAAESITSIENGVVNKAEKAHVSIDGSAQEVREAASSFIQSPLDANVKTSSSTRPIDSEITNPIQQASDMLKAKAELDFTANDHYVRGRSLYASSNFQGALASFESAIQAAVNASAAEQVNYLFAKAFALDALGEPEAKIKVYDEIDGRFGRDASPGVRELVLKGLGNKGFTLGQQGKSAESINVYDEMDRRFGSDAAPEIRVLVVKGLVNKGVMLDQQGKSAEAIKIYDEMDRRFGSDASPGVREQLAMGLVSKGNSLGRQRKFAESINVYDEMDRRFGSEASPGMRVQIAMALNGMGFSQMMLAKEHWSDEPQRQSRLSSASVVLERAAAMCGPDERAMIQGNLGYALFLAGKVQVAQVPTLKCLKLGGQKALDDQRADAKLHRVEPEDTHYEQLLDELWHSLPTSKE